MYYGEYYNQTLRLLIGGTSLNVCHSYYINTVCSKVLNSIVLPILILYNIIAPGDYTSQDALPVTLDLESPQVFILVTIVDDNVYDGTKIFYATISSQSERVSISENRTRVIVRDNEGKIRIFLVYNVV